MTPRENVARDTPIPLVTAVSLRLAAAHLFESCALGLTAAAIVIAVMRHGGWFRSGTPDIAGALLGGCTAIAWFPMRRKGRTTRAAAVAIERRIPAAKNVVVTAEELTAHPERARTWIRQRVLADAATVTATLKANAVVPLRLRMLGCLLALAAMTVAVFNVHPRTGSKVAARIEDRINPLGAGDARMTLNVALEPPSHTGLPAQTLADPERITAVEATAARITIGGVGRARVRFGSTMLKAQLVGGKTVADIVLRESGYLSIESDASQRLIPVVVSPDHVPVISIDRPGRDLLLPHVAPSVAVEATATDDFGLDLLSLRYTKVSGSGEQFEFVEGELPLAVARESARIWRGRGEFALGRLGLEPGDSLVYRVVARDRRPGSRGLASSDTFFIEVAGPGQVALEGFEMPPDGERHALSQQMIVLKIQRLREAEGTLSPASVRERAASIAAEQRAVRANFVFLMGGDVEDEEDEAEHSNEVQEGRLENTARREMFRAVGHMSSTEQGLIAVDSSTALKEATLAVAALQRAFGRNRYILRTLPARSRIDPARRLTGTLDEANDWIRQTPAASRGGRAPAIMNLLTEVIAAAEGIRTGEDRASLAERIGRLSEQALAIDATAPEWQQISSTLVRLRHAVASKAAPEIVDRAVRDTLHPLVAEARRVALRRAAAAARSSTLRGAWAEEARRR